MIKRFNKGEINAVINTIKSASYLSGYTNKFLGGEQIQKFESEFARFHKCRYGITVNSGTSALLIAQKAAGVKNKTKVAIPCITFTATTSSVIACGGIPPFSSLLNTLTYFAPSKIAFLTRDCPIEPVPPVTRIFLPFRKEVNLYFKLH